MNEFSASSALGNEIIFWKDENKKEKWKIELFGKVHLSSFSS
jgi:hypothetical protein